MQNNNLIKFKENTNSDLTFEFVFFYILFI